MEHQGSTEPDALTAWDRRVEFVEPIATCRCGHTMNEHAGDSCTVGNCECRQTRDDAIDAEVEAVDEL
jgi:hypothetical protein